MTKINVNEIGERYKETKDIACLGELYNYVQRLTGYIIQKNSHQGNVHDIAGSIILKIHDKIDQFDAERGEFKNWLYAMITNDILFGYRELRKTSDCIDVYGNDLVEELPDYMNICEEEDSLTYEDVIEAFRTFDPTDYIGVYNREIMISLKDQSIMFKEYVVENLSLNELLERHPEHKLNDNSAKTMLRRMRYAFVQHLMKLYPGKVLPASRIVDSLIKKNKI